MKAYKYFRKLAVLIAGITVIIIGIILLPLPGPGMLIIAFGLLILSTEFEWAERHLATLKLRLKQVIDKSKAKASKADKDKP